MEVGAGPLRQRVIIERATESLNALGETTLSWATQATRWMRVEPISGRELFEAHQVNPRTSHRVTMRYDSTTAVTPDDRLNWGGRILNIESVANVGERDRYTVMQCSEEV